MTYDDLLKMVYFDDIEFIEGYVVNKQQENKDRVLQEMLE